MQISRFHQLWICLENEEIGFLPYFQRSNITSQSNLPSRVYSDTTPSLLKAESLLLTEHFACCSYQMGGSHVDVLKRVDMADGRAAVKSVDETDVYIISRWIDSLASWWAKDVATKGATPIPNVSYQITHTEVQLGRPDEPLS